MHRALVAAVQAALRPCADASRAVPMAAYMKNQFTFLGVDTTTRRQRTRALIRALIRAYRGDVLAAAQTLWTLPEREYAYVACDLLRQYAKRLTPNDLPGVRQLILTHSWWDTVDNLAVCVGEIVLHYPDCVQQMDDWIQSEFMWLRRAALLHQLMYKNQTNVVRLLDHCLRCAPEKDFFIRKAIGWALRQYAHVDSGVVFRFVRSHESEFSALTIREALKHVSG